MDVVVLALFLLLSAAAYSDVRRREVPNTLVVLVVALGVGWASELWHSLLMSAFVFMVTFPMYWGGFMSPGDVKLYSAVAMATPTSIMLILVLSGAFTLAYAVLKKVKPSDGAVMPGALFIFLASLGVRLIG